MLRRDFLKTIGLGVGTLFAGGAVAVAMAKPVVPKRSLNWTAEDERVLQYGLKLQRENEEWKQTLADSKSQSEPVLFVGGPYHGDIRDWTTHGDRVMLCGRPRDGGGWPLYYRRGAYAYSTPIALVDVTRKQEGAAEDKCSVESESDYRRWVEYWHPSLEKFGTFRGVPLYMDKPIA